MKYGNMRCIIADHLPHCDASDHPQRERPVASAESLERASRIFRALGDAPRLRLLELLAGGESCVTEIVQAMGEKFSTISQRLRLLRSEGLIKRRRAGTHIFYGLADQHVMDLIRNAVAHAAELEDGGALRHAASDESRSNPGPRRHGDTSPRLAGSGTGLLSKNEE
jgi:ArsR family transcriptional regulator